jgi:cytochrome c oxidase subunit 3
MAARASRLDRTEDARAAIVHAPQFDDLAQQRTAATLGIWVFLLTEIMLFGALLTSYTVYRFLYPAGFTEGSRHLELVLGGLNTAVLIGSSLTMALAVHAAETGARRALLGFLAATIALGLTFLGIKAIEYWHHYQDSLMPGVAFAYDGPLAHQVELFFRFYFILTAIHAVHLTIGLGVVTTMLVLAWRGQNTNAHATRIEVTGLYWHFVDIVWIFLLPLLYLLGRS